MIKLEAYSVLAGLHVRVAGICTTLHVDNTRCEGVLVSTTVPAEQIEEVGVRWAVSQALRDALWLEHDLGEFLYH